MIELELDYLYTHVEFSISFSIVYNTFFSFFYVRVDETTRDYFIHASFCTVVAYVIFSLFQGGGWEGRTMVETGELASTSLLCVIESKAKIYTE